MTLKRAVRICVGPAVESEPVDKVMSASCSKRCRFEHAHADQATGTALVWELADCSHHSSHACECMKTWAMNCPSTHGSPRAGYGGGAETRVRQAFDES